MTSDDGQSVRRVIQRSFSRKIAVLFLFVLVIIAAVGVGIYAQTGTAVQERTESQMKQTTVLQANTVSGLVDQTKDRTRHIAASDAVASGDETRTVEFLRGELEESPASVSAIHYYDTASGDVIASTASDVAGATYRSEDIDWGLEASALDQREDTVLSSPYVDPTTGEKSIAFVRTTPADTDRAIVTVVDLETLTEELERPSTNDDSFTHIVDARGTVVMSHHAEKINTQNMGPEDEYAVESMGVSRGLDGETGYVEMEMPEGHHDKMAMGFTRVEGTDWVIMTHVPTESAFALQSTIQESVIALIVLSLLGLGAVGAVIVRNTTRPIGELAEKAAELESGNLDADLETNRVDEIGQLYESFDGMRTALRQRIHEVEETRARTERLNDHLEEKASEYSAVMQECGDGDLTQRMDEESESEAMTEIAVEFNQMIADIEATVTRLSRFADEVAAASEEATASSEEVRAASEQVTESIQEISDGAEKQNQNLQAVNEEMSGLSTTIEQIAASSNNVADLAERTASTGSEGRTVATETIEGMNEVERDSQQTIEAIESLEAEIGQIDELVEFITDVAQQTNMLALNANIEATRSNESADGFTAVAGEVKELAEETKEAAEDIEARIEEIKAQTRRTSSEVRQTSEQIAEQRESVENTVEALEEIAEYASETSEGVQEISAATEQQAASTEEVVSMVDQAATISEETTNEAETVAAAGEEQTTALTEVSQSVNDLSQQAAALSSKLDEFSTDADPAPSGSSFDEASAPIASNDDGSFVVDREPATVSRASGDDSDADEETELQPEPDAAPFSFGEATKSAATEDVTDDEGGEDDDPRSPELGRENQ